MQPVRESGIERRARLIWLVGVHVPWYLWSANEAVPEEDRHPIGSELTVRLCLLTPNPQVKVRAANHLHAKEKALERDPHAKGHTKGWPEVAGVAPRTKLQAVAAHYRAIACAPQQIRHRTPIEMTGMLLDCRVAK